jgi:ubiquinone/menaquinone biosynthesis C-methylase UbiE
MDGEICYKSIGFKFFRMKDIIKMDDFQELLGNFHGGRILDVACGGGQFIDVLVNSLASWEHITGLDLSDDIMMDARQKFGGDKFSFVSGSALDIPFESESFDMVCISKGLHHLPDPIHALTEMLRVVRPFGAILISEMYSDGLNAAQESAKMYHHLRVEVDNLMGIDHFNTFCKEELFELMSILPFQETGVFEYIEPAADPFDPLVLKEYIEKMEGWIDELKDHPEKDNIIQKLQRVEEKMNKDGFSKPPLLIFLGYKI